MPYLNEQETEALLVVDSRKLSFPTERTAEVASTWHHWLAYEELQSYYGWSEAELLQLVALESETTGHGLTVCFERVIAYAYADCRHEMADLVEADIWLPLIPSGYRPRSAVAINEAYPPSFFPIAFTTFLKNPSHEPYRSWQRSP